MIYRMGHEKVAPVSRLDWRVKENNMRSRTTSRGGTGLSPPSPPGRWSYSIACCWPWLISPVYGRGLHFRGPSCRTSGFNPRSSWRFCAVPKEGKADITQFTISFTTSNIFTIIFKCGNFSFEKLLCHTSRACQKAWIWALWHELQRLLIGVNELSITFSVFKKLRGLSPRANYTDRAAAAGQRS